MCSMGRKRKKREEKGQSPIYLAEVRAELERVL